MKTDEELMKEIMKSVETTAEIRFNLITIGSYIVPTKDQHFTFTKERFITRGKRYNVINIVVKSEGKFIETESDLPNETAWHSLYGIKNIII
jgi:hypothetical protein